MSPIEQEPKFESAPDFGMNFDMGNFDINAAFQDAITNVVSDSELALEEKVRRMEFIVSEGVSEVYRGFVDLSQMAARMAIICSDDHTMNKSMQGSDILTSLISGYGNNDGHDHNNNPFDDHHDHKDDEYEIDPKTGKRTKKKKKHA